MDANGDPTEDACTVSVEQASSEDFRLDNDGLYAFNRSIAGDDHHQPLIILMRRSTGEIADGLLGATYWGWLHITTTKTDAGPLGWDGRFFGGGRHPRLSEEGSMAADTPQAYRNLVLYEVYVRNHGPNGTFADLESDLPRIREMGVDVVWLMPIHPIGVVGKKGSLGCPYSIADYREVNLEYGTKADLQRLVDRAHELNLKMMIDVVYNHTAHDSVLMEAHPDWYHQDHQGRPVTTVPEWSDVIDLKHPNPALANHLIETLQMWADFGVDGFRCDVASLLPLEFWLAARAAVAEVKPGVIWLAESVQAGWVAERRAAGLPMLSDGELYRAFDLTYDYDIWPIWRAAVQGSVPTRRYLEMVRFQDCIYPTNYVKMRCVENHDNERIMALASSRSQALAWTAFQAFNKGAFLIYAGQEAGAVHTPSLFDLDTIDWGQYELQPFFSTLCRLKKDPAQREGRFLLLSAEPAIEAVWLHSEGGLLGVFNTQGRDGRVNVPLTDGDYTDLLSKTIVRVRKGQLNMPDSAVVLRSRALTGDHTSAFRPFHSDLLDHAIA